MSAGALDQINQWEPSGGWPTEPMVVDLSFRAPRTPCPHCSVEGVTSAMEVVAVTVTGGEAALLWHMSCERGHAHSFPACIED
jgi:hypothetical protein